MAIDRAALFRLAWTWAKQDLWSVRAPASRLRAFFKVSLAQAWREMKRRAAARAAAIAPAANARPVEVVRAEIWAFECKDSIRGADWLCCTNRVMAEVPLSPDGLIPQLP